MSRALGAGGGRGPAWAAPAAPRLAGPASPAALFLPRLLVGRVGPSLPPLLPSTLPISEVWLLENGTRSGLEIGPAAGTRPTHRHPSPALLLGFALKRSAGPVIDCPRPVLPTCPLETSSRPPLPSPVPVLTAAWPWTPHLSRHGWQVPSV